MEIEVLVWKECFSFFFFSFLFFFLLINHLLWSKVWSPVRIWNDYGSHRKMMFNSFWPYLFFSLKKKNLLTKIHMKSRAAHLFWSHPSSGSLTILLWASCQVDRGIYRPVCWASAERKISQKTKKKKNRSLPWISEEWISSGIHSYSDGDDRCSDSGVPLLYCYAMGSRCADFHKSSKVALLQE